METVGINPSSAIALIAAAAVIPFIAIGVTGFAKISIILMILRSALGLQQTPPAIVIYGISVILAAYISAPVFMQSFENFKLVQTEIVDSESFFAASENAKMPLLKFLHANTDEVHLNRFAALTKKIWKNNANMNADINNLFIASPAFLISEITEAFKIGFLIYLPFLAIDLIVTTILISLGMMMVPPSTISIPFKLLLFIYLDGWSVILEGIVFTYI